MLFRNPMMMQNQQLEMLTLDTWQIKRHKLTFNTGLEKTSIRPETSTKRLHGENIEHWKKFAKT